MLLNIEYHAVISIVIYILANIGTTKSDNNSQSEYYEVMPRVHEKKWIFNYVTSILYIQFLYLDIEL